MVTGKTKKMAEAQQCAAAQNNHNNKDILATKLQTTDYNFVRTCKITQHGTLSTIPLFIKNMKIIDGATQNFSHFHLTQSSMMLYSITKTTAAFRYKWERNKVRMEFYHN